MQSNDLVIRTERNLIDVVISTEGEVKLLRREFEDFKATTQNEFKNMRQEMQSEFKLVRQEIDGLNRTIDTMISIFGWGFALVAIAVAIAPMLRELFIYRQEKHNDEELERKIRKILSEQKDS